MSGGRDATCRILSHAAISCSSSLRARSPPHTQPPLATTGGGSGGGGAGMHGRAQALGSATSAACQRDCYLLPNKQR